MWSRMSLDGIYDVSHSSYAFPDQAFQCHTDQDNHRRMKCDQPCVKIACPRAHPCPNLCSDPCGNCMFPVYSVKLPCGHTAKSIPWRVPSEFASKFHLTLSTVINSRSWTRSSVSLKCRSVYQAANTAASWLAAKIPPVSNARKFAKAS
jgi:hypothetical protein